MQTIAQLVADWHRQSGLSDRAQQAAPAAAEQIASAVEALTLKLSEADGGESRVAVVDAWFAEALQRPPVSHDTDLYNRAHAAVHELKARLATA